MPIPSEKLEKFVAWPGIEPGSPANMASALKANFVLLDKLVRVGGWPGGWEDHLEIRLNSASVEVEAELGKRFSCIFTKTV